MKLYLNGALVSAGIASLPLSGIVDTNNWLGKSPFVNDPYFTGKYNDVRIFSGLMSDADVFADYQAGPNSIGVDFRLHSYISTNNVSITWGQSASNGVLQSSASLGADANWVPVVALPSLQNGRFTVTLPTSGNCQYFRLSIPPAG